MNEHRSPHNVGFGYALNGTNTSFKKYPTFLGFAIDNPTKVGYTLDCEQEILTTKTRSPKGFLFFSAVAVVNGLIVWQINCTITPTGCQ